MGVERWGRRGARKLTPGLWVGCHMQVAAASIHDGRGRSQKAHEVMPVIKPI